MCWEVETLSEDLVGDGQKRSLNGSVIDVVARKKKRDVKGLKNASEDCFNTCHKLNNPVCLCGCGGRSRHIQADTNLMDQSRGVTDRLPNKDTPVLENIFVKSVIFILNWFSIGVKRSENGSITIQYVVLSPFSHIHKCFVVLSSRWTVQTHNEHYIICVMKDQ